VSDTAVIDYRDSFKERTAPAFFAVYLDALDEELLALLTSISMHKPSSTMIKVEEFNEWSQSDDGQTEVGKRDYIVR
jgi:hypothetical protein